MVPGFPPLSLSAGGGGPSGATANNGISLPINIPLNLDHSGWNVSVKSSGNQSATGNSDANGISSGGLGDLLGGGKNTPLILLGGLALLLVLRR